MASVWLTAVAWLYLFVCFCCAAIIAYDIAFNRRRQPMGVMNFVFPITALYFGPFALALYWHWGRVMHGDQNAYHEMSGAARPHGADQPAPPDERARPWWVTMAIEVSHCRSA